MLGLMREMEEVGTAAPVSVKQEDHRRSRSDTRLQAMVEFLRANNPPE